MQLHSFIRNLTLVFTPLTILSKVHSHLKPTHRLVTRRLGAGVSATGSWYWTHSAGTGSLLRRGLHCPSPHWLHLGTSMQTEALMPSPNTETPKRNTRSTICLRIYDSGSKASYLFLLKFGSTEKVITLENSHEEPWALQLRLPTLWLQSYILSLWYKMRYGLVVARC